LTIAVRTNSCRFSEATLPPQLGSSREKCLIGYQNIEGDKIHNALSGSLPEENTMSLKRKAFIAAALFFLFFITSGLPLFALGDTGGAIKWTKVKSFEAGDTLPLHANGNTLVSINDMENNNSRLLLSTDQGASFKLFYKPEKGVIKPLEQLGNSILIAHNQNNFFPESSLIAISVETGDAVPLQRFNGNIESFVTGRKNELFFGTTHGDIFYSPDSGRTVHLLGYIDSEPVVALLHTSKGELLAATGNRGLVNFGKDRSQWMQKKDADDAERVIGRGATNGTVIGDFFCMSCLAEPRPGHIFVSSGQGIFSTTDNGKTWRKSSLKLSVEAMIHDQHLGLLVAASMGNGCYVSRDLGGTWISANNGLENLPGIISLASDQQGTVYAGTRDQGLYKAKMRGDLGSDL
jgi:ligand-binding sensor domain-containing protein